MELNRPEHLICMKNVTIKIEVVSSYSIKYKDKETKTVYTGSWWQRLLHIGPSKKTVRKSAEVVDVPEDAVYNVTVQADSKSGNSQANTIGLTKNRPVEITYDLDLFRCQEGKLNFSLSIVPSCRVFHKLPINLDKKNHTLCLNVTVTDELGQTMVDCFETVFKCVGCNLPRNIIEYFTQTGGDRYKKKICSIDI